MGTKKLDYIFVSTHTEEALLPTKKFFPKLFLGTSGKTLKHVVFRQVYVSIFFTFTITSNK